MAAVLTRFTTDTCTLPRLQWNSFRSTMCYSCRLIFLHLNRMQRMLRTVCTGWAMCRLAIAPYPCFSVSDYELQQKTVSYTIHTISALRQEWTDVELVLLMGSDMLLQFQNWYRWQELLTMTELGVIARETDDRTALQQAAQELSAYGTIQLCCDRVLPISSTKIREMLKKNQDCTCYLPENVVKYIVFHQLYQRTEEKENGKRKQGNFDGKRICD